MVLGHLRRAMILGARRAPQKQSIRTCYPASLQANVTMPATPVSFAEKIFWFTALATSLLSVPLWVLYHLPEYRGEERLTGMHI